MALTMGIDCQRSAQAGKSMVMFLAGVAAGVVLGAALGWRGLAVLAAVGIALLLATTSGIDLAALWVQLGEYGATLTDSLTP